MKRPEAMSTREALEATLPLLIRLGDFIGNGEGPDRMDRCNAILAVRAAIARIDRMDRYSGVCQLCGNPDPADDGDP